MAKFNTATMKTVANLHKTNPNWLISKKAQAVLDCELAYSNSYENAETTRTGIKNARIAAKKVAKDTYTAAILAAKKAAKIANGLADTTYETANRALTNATPLKLELLKTAYQKMLSTVTSGGGVAEEDPAPVTGGDTPLQIPSEPVTVTTTQQANLDLG